jgi:hypothetical protein
MPVWPSEKLLITIVNSTAYSLITHLRTDLTEAATVASITGAVEECFSDLCIAVDGFINTSAVAAASCCLTEEVTDTTCPATALTTIIDA